MNNERSVNFPMILYITVLYVCPFIVFPSIAIILFTDHALDFIPRPVGAAMLIICFIAHGVSWIVNLFYAMKSALLGWNEQRSIRCLTFKFIIMPYHIVYFAFFLLFFLASGNPFLMWTWLFVPLEILHSYVVLLATSVHGIAQALRLKRAGMISNKKFVIIVLLLLTFVLDFIGGSMLATADKRARENMTQCESKE